MIEEIRVYYECLEQANHFIKPAINKTFNDIPLKLIRLKKNFNLYGKRLAKIIYWKDPDVLITIVSNKKEYPLIFIEFSNAVFTEDHELQRFDGLVASAENNCIYVKISPITKKSLSDHGGNIDFNYLNSFALILTRYERLFFHFDWSVDKKGVVEVQKEYLSCPNKDENFELLLSTVLETFKSKEYSDDWQKETNKKLLKNDFFKNWYESLKNIKLEKYEELNTSRTRWIKEDQYFGKDFFELKLNRFGHAMDPERGMLSYYGTMLPKIISKMRFVENNDAWYKDIQTERKIASYIKSNGLKKARDFLYCFIMGSGLYDRDDFKKIWDEYKENQENFLEINITEFLNINFLGLNKALRTIFKYSQSFYIEDNNGAKRVILKWDKFNGLKKFDKLPEITPLIKLSSLDEDLITYITIHNILIPNGYKIIAASYPGAQADRVILIEPATGRKQKRKYIDIISYLPNKKVTAMQENKDEYLKSSIQEEIIEISKYKTDKSYKEALKTFQTRFESSSVGSVLKIGVGFWSSPRFTLATIKDLDLKELDYFVYVGRDMKKWNIWRTGNIDIFKNNKGEVKLPELFEINENASINLD